MYKQPAVGVKVPLAPSFHAGVVRVASGRVYAGFRLEPCKSLRPRSTSEWLVAHAAARLPFRFGVEQEKWVCRLAGLVGASLL